MPLSIDMRAIARVQVVAWEDGEWGIVWETRDGQRGSNTSAVDRTRRRSSWPLSGERLQSACGNG